MVTTWVELAGQSVTVASHLVMVWTSVMYEVEWMVEVSLSGTGAGAVVAGAEGAGAEGAGAEPAGAEGAGAELAGAEGTP